MGYRLIPDIQLVGWSSNYWNGTSNGYSDLRGGGSGNGYNFEGPGDGEGGGVVYQARLIVEGKLPVALKEDM